MFFTFFSIKSFNFFKNILQNPKKKFFRKNFFFKKIGILNNFYFLRKIKIFVKNKYSRNRQWSKNMIYFGV